MRTGTFTRPASTSATTPSDTPTRPRRRSLNHPHRRPHRALDESSSSCRAAHTDPMARLRKRAAPISWSPRWSPPRVSPSDLRSRSPSPARSRFVVVAFGADGPPCLGVQSAVAVAVLGAGLRDVGSVVVDAAGLLFSATSERSAGTAFLVLEGGPAFRLARKGLPARSGAAVTGGRSEAEDRGAPAERLTAVLDRARGRRFRA